MKRAKILHTRPVKWLYRVTQRVPFPGIKDISLYAVLEFFVRSISKKDLQMRTSALSFTFFLALFPSTIFFFTLIAYLPFHSNHDKILFFIQELIPKNAYLTIQDTLNDILKHQRGKLLSIGFISAMYFSTNGFHSLMNSLNKYSHFKETRTFWKQRFVALGLSIFVSVLLLLSVLLITVGTISIKWLAQKHLIPNWGVAYTLNVANYVVVAFLCLIIIASIFYYAPAKSKPLRFFSAGALFSCIVILITMTGFSYYVNQFNTYNKVYGSIGVLIVIMMLIYINTYILLLGYELNVAIDLALDQENRNKNRRLKVNKITYLEDTINNSSNSQNIN